MRRFSLYIKFTIFFSILMLIGIVGIVLTHIIDLAVIETSMPWLITFANSIGINDIESARRVITIYVGVVYLFVFWFTCLAFKHGHRTLNRVKNARAQSTQVYITTDEDVKKMKKKQEKKQAEDKKMKSREERIAARAERKAAIAAKKAEKHAKKEVKKEVKEAVAPTVEKVQEVKTEKIEPKVKKASNKIDNILDSLK